VGSISTQSSLSVPTGESFLLIIRISLFWLSVAPGSESSRVIIYLWAGARDGAVGVLAGVISDGRERVAWWATWGAGWGVRVAGGQKLSDSLFGFAL